MIITGPLTVGPLPYQDTMIVDSESRSGDGVDTIVSDGLLQFLDNLRLAGNTANANVGNGSTVGATLQNGIVDGSFEVWDGNRGAVTALAAATGYTGCTMWSYSAGANFNNYFAQRQPGLTPSSRFCLRYARNATSVDVATQFLIQDFESVNSLQYAGVPCTLSFLARAGSTYSAAGGVLVTSIITGTGTDQAARTAPYTGQLSSSVLHTLSTTTQRFSHSFTPSAALNQIAIFFGWTPVGTAGAADYVEIDDAQFQPSTYPTNFERLPWGVIRLQTLRHYQKSFTYDTAPVQNSGTAAFGPVPQPVGAGVATRTQHLPWNVPFRATPTGTLYNPNAANGQVRNLTTAADCTASSIASTENRSVIVFTTAAGSAIGDLNAVHYTLDARI